VGFANSKVKLSKLKSPGVPSWSEEGDNSSTFDSRDSISLSSELYEFLAGSFCFLFSLLASVPELGQH